LTILKSEMGAFASPEVVNPRNDFGCHRDDFRVQKSY
jgi:hypothetical protein